MSLQLYSLHSSKQTIINNSHRYCDSQNREYKVLRSTKIHLSIGCGSPTSSKDLKCSFRVNANVQPDNQWKITTSKMSHSCTGEAFRKRQVNTRTLQNTATAIKQFAPVAGGKNYPAQLIQTVKNSYGITLKYTQAHSISKSKETNSPIHHYQDYAFLPHLIEVYKDSDPNGMYELVTFQDGNGHDRFKSVYVVFSGSILFWPFTRKV
jgi:hypothetical protein